MDWEALQEKYDSKQILSWLRTLSDQCLDACAVAAQFTPKKRKIEKIVACGMGGSGVGANILRNLLKHELKVPFEAFNSYKLPRYVDSKTLFFCVSFSGNTEETLECFKQAKKKRAYTVSITTDGKLKGMAKHDLMVIPAGAPLPRMGIAYLSLPMLIVLEKMRLVEGKNKQIKEAIGLLKKEGKAIEEKAKELALKMQNKLPIIYAPEELSTISYRFRTELNENAKQFAFNHFLPEHNHNEINARLVLSRESCEIFFLRWSKEDKRVSKRFEVLKEVVSENFNVTEVELKGNSLLAATFYALQLASLASYYLALLNNLDPYPMPLLDAMKERME